MRPFSLGITTFVQGLFTAMALIVLADVVSPTFNVEGFPDWTAMQTVMAAVVLFMASLPLGVVMHTLARSLFHDYKESWTVEVLTSEPVARRIAALESKPSSPGGPTYREAMDADEEERRHKCFEYMHGIDSQLLMRAPHVFDVVQVYRGQYRLARGLVVPSLLFALTLPFWGAIKTLDGAGSIGPFPIIRTQLLLLSVLAAIVCVISFRERAYRYAAAKVMAYVTMQGSEEEEG